MKITTSALAAALALSSASAFVVPRAQHVAVVGSGDSFIDEQQRRSVATVAVQSTLRPSSSSASSSSAAAENNDSSNSHGHSRMKDIHVEIASGKVLEGGAVIDFESVKASSRAEDALLAAKNAILATVKDGTDLATLLTSKATSTSTDILGINDEVIAEVGHKLATFATPEQIQNCASYIRSKAPAGLFQTRDAASAAATTTTTYSSSDVEQLNGIIRKAYEESGEVTSAFAKTFYLGTQVLPEAPREAIWAIYVWCRRTDEIVDAPREDDDEMLSDLAQWEMRLENLWKYGDVVDVYDLCMLDVLVNYPTLPITPFMDMIRGMLMDVPDLGQNRYDTFDELHLYCYRVAGTVGLMSLPVFGCAKGYNEDIAREPALSLGVAFQLTNILRDVGEDAVQRGRIYLPYDDMAKFGVTEEQIFAQRMDQNYANMMKYQIDRARMYYQRARRGVFMLAPESRLPVQLSLDAYGSILNKIENNGYDSLTTRAYVGKWEKLSKIPFSWYRTLDISKTLLPLPGDDPVIDEE
mmetsp:Transcript_16578/g.46361  ORF Transcript_16578/g.46361 Transcript_16578/m.46361 type:complete len:526 (-) Transcript_16578:193-1770(-)|eukprot:CAMPEP_0119552866 /NCGR_PEP_ID=MMETSP1352-20130426/5754_1 /TAXON_ID=265584 /ORGANISM="Stauroneis constricta, Strain CCMP1120" /LENGTH=525 /DNA_ID=CAMNT_0007599171 /DNA_START=331 /DNA_END=1908 /DNA_ORIENTATION=+